MGPFGSTGGPEEARYQAKVCGNHNLNPVRQLAAIGTKSGPPGPSETLWGPQKGLLGPKRALLGALGARKRPNTRSKCLVTMIPTQSDQLAAIGTKSGPPGPSETLWGPNRAFWGQKGPFGGPWSAVEVC